MRIPRGILEWYSEGLRILCEFLENTNAMRYSGGILWYSRTFDEYGAHTLPHARILVYSCAFLMYSVEYGQFWEMCRIRVELRVEYGRIRVF